MFLEVWCQQKPGSQDELFLFLFFHLFLGYLSTVFSSKGRRIKFLPVFPGKKMKFYFCLFRNKVKQKHLKQTWAKDF